MNKWKQILSLLLPFCILPSIAACNSGSYDWDNSGWEDTDWWDEDGDFTYEQIEDWVYDMSDEEWCEFWCFLEESLPYDLYCYIDNMCWEDFIAFLTYLINS